MTQGYSSQRHSRHSLIQIMIGTVAALLAVLVATKGLSKAEQASSCPAYGDYSQKPHGPYSSGPLKLPYQRPKKECREFSASSIEKVVDSFKANMEDPDLARLFENCYPNTCDTTVKWHVDSTNTSETPRTFVITGDINAQWLRDSRYQMSNYHALAPFDASLRTMLKGAIHQHAEFVAEFPHCNAFQPPPESEIEPNDVNPDKVYPPIDTKKVWECMFELDSLASFYGFASDYHEATGETDFIDSNWIKAAQIAMETIESQQEPTYAPDGHVNEPGYTFQREITAQGTLSLKGAGFPVNNNTHLVKSPFRPSDDVGIFQFFIPSNALLSVELRRAAKWLKNVDRADSDGEDSEFTKLIEKMETLSKQIHDDIWTHAVFDHPDFGKVFAYEIDGYGSHHHMDDANVPSLLALSDIGFVDQDDDTYQRTRKMVLSSHGNPYFVSGKYFNGIGSPHIDLESMWPMSHILKIRTSDDDEEIKGSIELLKKSTGGLGLMHESINVNKLEGSDSYTRSWFAWVNTEFAKAIIDLADRKPYLIFKTNKKLTPQMIVQES